MQEPIKIERISATQAKFIKLGEKGSWEKKCLAEGILSLGFYELSHDMGLSRDKDAIAKVYKEKGKDKKTISSYTRQFFDFYHTDVDTLWITFHGGHLYWCFALPEVHYLGADEATYLNGSRMRKTLNGWSNTSLSGNPLSMTTLSGNLTKLSRYPSVICAMHLDDMNHLIRKINDEDLPVVTAAKAARHELKISTVHLVKLLGWNDFELLVDLIFSQSGWRRIGRLGGDQKTVDLDLILPITEEKAAVQVKSHTDQKELDSYLESFTTRGADRYFYVYHSNARPLICNNAAVTLMDAEIIAEHVLQAGMFDWLLQKVV